MCKPIVCRCGNTFEGKRGARLIFLISQNFCREFLHWKTWEVFGRAQVLEYSEDFK